MTHTTGRVCLNREWTFVREDIAGAQAVGFDDASWQRIGLPHTFDLPYFRTPEFYVGYGWYRKRIEWQPQPGERSVFLEFDGVFQEAEIFLNGQLAGTHRGGYTGFSIDVTPLIRPGENLIAVRVNNEWNAQQVPRAGEHIFSGGIYRDVHLLDVDALHITWNGISVTTPTVSREVATLRASVEVHCARANPTELTLSLEVIDPAGKPVTRAQAVQTLRPGETVEISPQLPPIREPRLWHPDHPHLYRLSAQLVESGRVIEESETLFGIRCFEWTADRGFFLNGEPLYLRGANIHQDHAGWGIAITQEACRRDVRLIKEAGFNFVRGAHYPHHPAFARACDELGMIFWSENCFWGKGGFGPEGYWNASAYPVNAEDFEPFEQSCREALREMIRINRNHPSIVVWSMTNEAFFTYNVDACKQAVRRLVEYSHELDPTRPAAIGGCQRGGFDQLGDVAGYNGDGARLYIDPGVPNMVSEYGAISKPYDAYDPFWGDLQTERYAWRSGEAIWCGFDYGTIAGRQGLKGILDHYRLPKRSWHWYREQNMGIAPPRWPEPGVAVGLRISAEKLTIQGTDAKDDCQLIVEVLNAAGEPISNSPPVTLTIESGPGEFPTGRSICFDESTDIKIVGGRAGMALRSYHAGTSAIRATSPGLKDATISITTVGEPRFFDGTTPIAPERPYVAPRLSEAATRALANVVNVARDRPSRASSELPNRPARAVNDGAESSVWQARADDAESWWLVDLEGFYQVSGSRVMFPGDGNWRFVIDLSEDGKNWTEAVDRRDSVNTLPVRNDIYPPGAVARYFRLRFVQIPDGQQPGLRDVEVYGVLSTR